MGNLLDRVGEPLDSIRSASPDVYAYVSFQVRASSIQQRNIALMNDVSVEDESVEYLKQAV